MLLIKNHDEPTEKMASNNPINVTDRKGPSQKSHSKNVSRKRKYSDFDESTNKSDSILISDDDSNKKKETTSDPTREKSILIPITVVVV